MASATTLRDIFNRLIRFGQTDLMLIDESGNPTGILKQEVLTSYVSDTDTLWQDSKDYIDEWQANAVSADWESFLEVNRECEKIVLLNTLGELEFSDIKSLSLKWQKNVEKQRIKLDPVINHLPLPVCFLTLYGELNHFNDSFKIWDPESYPVEWGKFIKGLLDSYHPHTGSYECEFRLRNEVFYGSVRLYKPEKEEPLFLCIFHPIRITNSGENEEDSQNNLNHKDLKQNPDSAFEQEIEENKNTESKDFEGSQANGINELQKSQDSLEETVSKLSEKVLTSYMKEGGFDLENYLREQEFNAISTAMRVVDNDVNLAARLLSISRAALQYKLNQFGIDSKA